MFTILDVQVRLVDKTSALMLNSGSSCRASQQSQHAAGGEDAAAAAAAAARHKQVTLRFLPPGDDVTWTP